MRQRDSSGRVIPFALASEVRRDEEQIVELGTRLHRAADTNQQMQRMFPFVATS